MGNDGKKKVARGEDKLAAAMCNPPSKFKVGDRVAAGRWPSCTSHPDLWQPPMEGRVISRLDPALAKDPFIKGMLKQWGMKAEDVENGEVIRSCDRFGLLLNLVPVRWDLGGAKAVSWERAEQLRTPGRELYDWNACREHARKALCTLPFHVGASEEGEMTKGVVEQEV